MGEWDVSAFCTVLLWSSVRLRGVTRLGYHFVLIFYVVLLSLACARALRASSRACERSRIARGARKTSESLGSELGK